MWDKNIHIIYNSNDFTTSELEYIADKNPSETCLHAYSVFECVEIELEKGKTRGEGGWGGNDRERCCLRDIMM